MSKNNKKFVCIFDPSHFLDSQDKLAKHMLKCKAMEKQSYLCCQYNPLHWVKHFALQEHQQSNSGLHQACPDKNKITKLPENSFSKILPEQISKYEFSLPFEIDMSMVQSSSLAKSKNPTKMQSHLESRLEDPNLISRKQKQPGFKKAKKTQLWAEPDIQSFLRHKGYKKGKSQVMSNRNRPESFIAHNDSFFF